MNSRLLATKLHLPAIPPKQMQRPQLIQRLNGGLAGLKMYGMASPSKHAILAEYGATPIDYRTKDFAGEPASRPELLRVLATVLKMKVLPNGKSLSLYGTSSYFLFGQKPYLEDWATLFTLLEGGMIKPVIAARFPILEAAQANVLLESGQVIGNVVLVSPQ